MDKAVAAAKAAFDRKSPYRKLDPTQRGELLLKLASLLERDQDVLAVSVHIFSLNYKQIKSSCSFSN